MLMNDHCLVVEKDDQLHLACRFSLPLFPQFSLVQALPVLTISKLKMLVLLDSQLWGGHNFLGFLGSNFRHMSREGSIRKRDFFKNYFCTLTKPRILVSGVG